ncbi:2,5-diamino-6-(ribosylamino)-4(3H)-pyrimidinone 5'-phosphate reductase [Mortierella sp. NVP85]|nr:2,5-diamino-6-(ribosylamino)-4(3H)-pyrimidinone 5'-phosphate reductase [Mortierella sp. NVP85]
MEQGDSAINRRNFLFNVNQPFEVATEEFHKEWWPLVSNVWAKTSTNYRSNGDSWTIHACRLSKPYRSSTRKDGIPNDKRRKTHARAAVPCEASIKITHVVATKKTRIERYKSTPDHSHTLDDVDKIKRPAALRELIEEQVWKDYSPPEIVAIVKEVAQRKGLGEIAMHLHRDEVANIQRKYRASAATAGGADGGQLTPVSKSRSRNTDTQEDHGSTNSESYRHERVKNMTNLDPLLGNNNSRTITTNTITHTTINNINIMNNKNNFRASFMCLFQHLRVTQGGWMRSWRGYGVTFKV